MSDVAIAEAQMAEQQAIEAMETQFAEPESIHEHLPEQEAIGIQEIHHDNHDHLHPREHGHDSDPIKTYNNAEVADCYSCAGGGCEIHSHHTEADTHDHDHSEVGHAHVHHEHVCQADCPHHNHEKQEAKVHAHEHMCAADCEHHKHEAELHEHVCSADCPHHHHAHKHEERLQGDTDRAGGLHEAVLMAAERDAYEYIVSQIQSEQIETSPALLEPTTIEVNNGDRLDGENDSNPTELEAAVDAIDEQPDKTFTVHEVAVSPLKEPAEAAHTQEDLSTLGDNTHMVTQTYTKETYEGEESGSFKHQEHVNAVFNLFEDEPSSDFMSEELTVAEIECEPAATDAEISSVVENMVGEVVEEKSELADTLEESSFFNIQLETDEQLQQAQDDTLPDELMFEGSKDEVDIGLVESIANGKVLLEIIDELEIVIAEADNIEKLSSAARELYVEIHTYMTSINTEKKNLPVELKEKIEELFALAGISYTDQFIETLIQRSPEQLLEIMRLLALLAHDEYQQEFIKSIHLTKHKQSPKERSSIVEIIGKWILNQVSYA